MCDIFDVVDTHGSAQVSGNGSTANDMTMISDILLFFRVSIVQVPRGRIDAPVGFLFRGYVWQIAEAVEANDGGNAARSAFLFRHELRSGGIRLFSQRLLAMIESAEGVPVLTIGAMEGYRLRV